MPRDYAKKKSSKNKRGASRSRKKKPFPTALVLLAIVLVSASAAGLIYLKWYFKPSAKVTHSPQPAQQKKSNKTLSTKKAAEQKVDKSTGDDIPLYDLHQDLTNKQVEIPAEDLKLPDNLDKYYYSMPCASFRERSRAEELKARIAMTGNNSQILEASYKGEKRYRVQLGPFTRKRSAEAVRHRLQDNNIQGCLINRHLK